MAQEPFVFSATRVVFCSLGCGDAGPVAIDGFSAGLRYFEDRRAERVEFCLAGWIVHDEEHAARASPQSLERRIVLEHRRRIREKRAVPKIVCPGVQHVELFAGVKIYAGCLRVSAVDDDCVAGTKFAIDGESQRLGPERWVKRSERQMNRN